MTKLEFQEFKSFFLYQPTLELFQIKIEDILFDNSFKEIKISRFFAVYLIPKLYVFVKKQIVVLIDLKIKIGKENLVFFKLIKKN